MGATDTYPSVHIGCSIEQAQPGKAAVKDSTGLTIFPAVVSEICFLGGSEDVLLLENVLLLEDGVGDGFVASTRAQNESEPCHNILH